jgi:hypothetical protein
MLFAMKSGCRRSDYHVRVIIAFSPGVRNHYQPQDYQNNGPKIANRPPKGKVDYVKIGQQKKNAD